MPENADVLKDGGGVLLINTTVVMPAQSRNASLPMLVTLEGIVSVPVIPA
jgi:hypothetical protein